MTEQNEAVGHAVRAAYMYAGMADVAALTGDSAYIKAIDRIWENITRKKYYITGGIGATRHGEAFGANYELPNHTAYCETCAAIGNVYVNHRLFLLHGESKYYDVLGVSSFVEEISCLVKIFFFTGNEIKSGESHFCDLMTRHAADLSRTVADLAADAVGIADRYIKEIPFSCCLIVGYGTLDHVTEVVELMTQFLNLFPAS